MSSSSSPISVVVAVASDANRTLTTFPADGVASATVIDAVVRFTRADALHREPNVIACESGGDDPSAFVLWAMRDESGNTVGAATYLNERNSASSSSSPPSSSPAFRAATSDDAGAAAAVDAAADAESAAATTLLRDMLVIARLSAMCAKSDTVIRPRLANLLRERCVATTAEAVGHANDSAEVLRRVLVKNPSLAGGSAPPSPTPLRRRTSTDRTKAPAASSAVVNVAQQRPAATAGAGDDGSASAASSRKGRGGFLSPRAMSRDDERRHQHYHAGRVDELPADVHDEWELYKQSLHYKALATLLVVCAIAATLMFACNSDLSACRPRSTARQPPRSAAM
jgi:hypothetical protein